MTGLANARNSGTSDVMNRHDELAERLREGRCLRLEGVPPSWIMRNNPYEHDVRSAGRQANKLGRWIGGSSRVQDALMHRTAKAIDLSPPL
jgi:hypothetical protein